MRPQLQAACTSHSHSHKEWGGGKNAFPALPQPYSHEASRKQHVSGGVSGLNKEMLQGGRLGCAAEAEERQSWLPTPPEPLWGG